MDNRRSFLISIPLLPFVNRRRLLSQFRVPVGRIISASVETGGRAARSSIPVERRKLPYSPARQPASQVIPGGGPKHSVLEWSVSRSVV